MIKKVIFALMWIIGFSASVSAQSTAVFEGEIELETFENSSDYGAGGIFRGLPPHH